MSLISLDPLKPKKPQVHTQTQRCRHTHACMNNKESRETKQSRARWNTHTHKKGRRLEACGRTASLWTHTHTHTKQQLMFLCISVRFASPVPLLAWGLAVPWKIRKQKKEKKKKEEGEKKERKRKKRTSKDQRIVCVRGWLCAAEEKIAKEIIAASREQARVVVRAVVWVVAVVV